MDPADEEIHTVMISLVPQGLVGIDILRNCQNPHKKGLVMMVKIIDSGACLFKSYVWHYLCGLGPIILIKVSVLQLTNLTNEIITSLEDGERIKWVSICQMPRQSKCYMNVT